MDHYQVCSNNALGAKNGLPQVSPGTWSVFNYISFKQNSGERFKAAWPSCFNYDVFLFSKVVLILANGADPGEIQHYVAFHLGLHCLPNYRYGISSIQRVNTFAAKYLKKQYPSAKHVSRTSEY